MDSISCLLMILIIIKFLQTVVVQIVVMTGLISYLHSSRTTTSVILETLGPGLVVGVGGGNTYYSDDPLWDGAGCWIDSTCCQFNNPRKYGSAL